MATVALNRPIHTLNVHKQRDKTWRFAFNYIVRKQFVKDQKKLGSWTRDQLVDLGPTFVKLGQIASSRVDLYPLEFTQELESLQDNVPPIDFIDDKIDPAMFRYFEETPFKSASIGQVHKATLMSGEDVIVKIKRPDIYEIMKNDTQNILDIVNFLEMIGVDTGTRTSYILNESIEYLLDETNYEKEIYNAKKFRKSMKGIDWVKVPKVYQEYSNDEIIVMEYVESAKLTEITDPSINKKKICEAIIKSYLIQTMDNGFFHADPHPGNLGFVKKGQLVFYDFGLIINVSSELSDGFKKLFIHIVNRDVSSFVEVLLALGIILPTTNVSNIELFFKTALNYLETLDVKTMDFDMDVLMDLAKTKPFVLPTSIVYLAKAFATVEGICVKLDPEFTYYSYLEPILKDMIGDEIFDVRSTIKMIVDIPSKIRDIDKSVVNLEKSRTEMKNEISKISDLTRDMLILGMVLNSLLIIYTS